MKFNPAPLKELQRLRSYSRRLPNGKRETWRETCDRILYSEDMGLRALGKFTDAEMTLLSTMLEKCIAFGSARFLWVGGTKWFSQPENNPGAYNCTSFRAESWEVFAMLMDLAMQGCGTGAIVEPDCLEQLPAIQHTLDVEVVSQPGQILPWARSSKTELIADFRVEEQPTFILTVGDSRQGWVDAYLQLLKISCYKIPSTTIKVKVDCGHVRPAGEKLKGFGGISNPLKLPELFPRIAKILNGATGRKLNSLEVCLVIDEAASVVVAGNIRRSAGMRQGSADDPVFTTAKDNLWQVDEQGNWRIDPARDALRMANHTRVFHHKPMLEECIESVTKQFRSGEGAIQWAGEAVARSNADLLDREQFKKNFIKLYVRDRAEAADYLQTRHLARCYRLGLEQKPIPSDELAHRMHRYGMNPCGEIISSNFFCNLASVHVNQLDPMDFDSQRLAFMASALQVAAFLQRGFVDPLQQQGRDWDPIVGVSFTGGFTFFTELFGTDWLAWWQAGRPDNWEGQHSNPVLKNHPWLNPSEIGSGYRFLEQRYLYFWREVVFSTVQSYCERHRLKVPNRCTTMKPEGSMTLLSGVGCNGFQPPKGWYYIRRMTFRRDDPIALAAIDYGYTVVPSQTDKDENGNLLTDPFDPRCTEWLVEVPVKEKIAEDFPDALNYDPAKFPVTAQFDWMMQVQNYYVTHNTSATLELREDEIEAIATRIYEAIRDDEGYISTTFLARSDAPFPRMPFERIDRDTYDQLVAGVESRRKSEDFQFLLDRHDNPQVDQGPQDSACSDGLCAVKSENSQASFFGHLRSSESGLEVELL